MKRKILLFSGGVDSTYLYNRYKDELDNIIIFNYGQPNFMNEFKHAFNTAGKRLEIMELNGLPRDKDDFVFGRNLRFFIALRERFIEDNIVIFFGHIGEDRYPDNTPGFHHKVEEILHSSYRKDTRIFLPLQNMTKTDVFDKLKNEYPSSLNNIWFCEREGPEPCKECASCQTMINAKRF